MLERTVVAVALFGVPPLLGLLIARRPGPTAGIRLRLIDLLVPLGLAVQLVQVLPRSTSLAIGYAFLVGWAAIRAATSLGPARVAFGTLLLGGLLNAVPILLNGAMPYSASAEHLAEGLKGVRIDDHTMLPMLGDIIPLPAGKFMSVGDVVLAIGTVLTVSLIVRTAPAPGARIPAHPASPGV
jgi:Family of unknown function (DUF5317)